MNNNHPPGTQLTGWMFPSAPPLVLVGCTLPLCILPWGFSVTLRLFHVLILYEKQRFCFLSIEELHSHKCMWSHMKVTAGLGWALSSESSTDKM